MKKISVFLLTGILFAACHSNTATSTIDEPVPTVAPEIGPAEDVAAAPVVTASKDSLADTSKNNGQLASTLKDSVQKPIDTIKKEAKAASIAVKTEASKIATKSEKIVQDAAAPAKKMAVKTEQKAKQLKATPKK